MLELQVPGQRLFNENTSRLITIPPVTLRLEHSLVSLSKWESKWEVPFLADSEDRTDEQTYDYIKCMTLTEDVPPEVYERLSPENLQDVSSYINAKMTATWFSEEARPGVKEVITAELIYYWMVSLQIPFECQYWHLNRLVTLVKVVNEKNAPEKKSSKPRQDLAAERRAMNKARQKKMNSTG